MFINKDQFIFMGIPQYPERSTILALYGREHPLIQIVPLLSEALQFPLFFPAVYCGPSIVRRESEL